MDTDHADITDYYYTCTCLKRFCFFTIIVSVFHVPVMNVIIIEALLFNYKINTVNIIVKYSFT